MNVNVHMAVTVINRMPSLSGILPQFPESRNAAIEIWYL